MYIYIDVGDCTWSFEKKPELPLKSHGEIWHIGWDIPTRWAVDASDQRWEDNAHGHPLQPVRQISFHRGLKPKNES